ncbi:hypothetical protein FKM82_019858 [Ascaphus truei]
MASLNHEDQRLCANKDCKRTGVTSVKPLLKPKPVIPPCQVSFLDQCSHIPALRDALTTPDCCPRSPNPDLPSALKITQLTGPQPYGTRRPSLKRWVSGGGVEVNQGGNSYSSLKSPTLDFSSSMITPHPVSVLSRPFRGVAFTKGLGPLLITSRGWGEQRWKQEKDTPERTTFFLFLS